MSAAMEHITPEEYISNIITADNIDESMKHLLETLELETHDVKKITRDTMLYTDWLEYYHKFAAEIYEKKKTSFTTLKKNIKFYKEKLRVYEKSLWSISNNKDNANWLMQLKEKNQRIDTLRSELFCYEKMDENCELIGDIDDFNFIFYLDSITRQILELELEIETLKDIEKNMKDHTENSTQKILKDKNKHDLKEWDNLLCCLLQNIVNVKVPVRYWLNRLRIQNLKSTYLISIRKLLTCLTDKINDTELQTTLNKLEICIQNYINEVQILLFVSCYNNSTTENIRMLTILQEQLVSLEDTFFKHLKESTISPKVILNERNDRVTILENQYAKLTEKSDKYIQDQITALSENVIKRRTEVQTVRNECEKSMEKHENECKIIMTDKYTSTLDSEQRKYPNTEEREYPVEEKKQQKEELSDEQKKEDKKKINDEAEAQHSKDDQMNNKDLKSIMVNNNLWKMKSENLYNEALIKATEVKFELYKEMLNKLMQSENDIEDVIATYQKENKRNHLINMNNKILLYFNIEQANFIEPALRRNQKQKGDYDLLKNNVAMNDIKSESNTSEECDSCETLNSKLHHVTNVICCTSQEITKTSAMFHMLPFKKFVRTISEYIITKEKAKSKRRNGRKQRKH
ncbi:uncharacterized protein LOC116846359 [Odontomachus brunneus]|uniref:uncharacterized protein LOC116846359 n=1 Tax=Odontomachus brunneus TaxID=486640 RepID=UPI0013F1D4D1|nr:uncharacterized protein LOC116846359 [Odontomachus brunneus]